MWEQLSCCANRALPPTLPPRASAAARTSPPCLSNAATADSTAKPCTCNVRAMYKWRASSSAPPTPGRMSHITHFPLHPPQAACPTSPTSRSTHPRPRVPHHPLPAPITRVACPTPQAATAHAQQKAGTTCARPRVRRCGGRPTRRARLPNSGEVETGGVRWCGHTPYPRASLTCGARPLLPPAAPG